MSYHTTTAATWTNGASTMSRGTTLVISADGVAVTPDHLCPDLLRWSNIGAADGLRGRVVRAFFWVMRLWPTK